MRGPPLHGGGSGVARRTRRQAGALYRLCSAHKQHLKPASPRAGAQHIPLCEPHPAALRARQRRGEQAGAGRGLGALQDRKGHCARRRLRLRRLHARALPRHRQGAHRGGCEGARGGGATLLAVLLFTCLLGLLTLSRTAGSDQEGAAAVCQPAVQEAGQAPGARPKRPQRTSQQLRTECADPSLSVCSWPSNARRARRRWRATSPTSRAPSTPSWLRRAPPVSAPLHRCGS